MLQLANSLTNQKQIRFSYKFSLNIFKKDNTFFFNPGILQLIKWQLVPHVPSMMRLFMPVDMACQGRGDNETGPVGGQVLRGK